MLPVILEVSSRPANGASLADEKFGEALTKLLPFLRNYAARLCGNSVAAEDLAQEAVTRGWMARSRFEPGTNLKSWLLTILRNYHFSQFRKYRHFCALESHDIGVPGEEAAMAVVELDAVRRAMGRLEPDQRQILIAVAAGSNYAELASQMRCPIGTAKSRVSRSREALRRLLQPRPRARRSVVRTCP